MYKKTKRQCCHSKLQLFRVRFPKFFFLEIWDHSNFTILVSDLDLLYWSSKSSQKKTTSGVLLESLQTSKLYIISMHASLMREQCRHFIRSVPMILNCIQDVWICASRTSGTCWLQLYWNSASMEPAFIKPSRSTSRALLYIRTMCTACFVIWVGGSGMLSCGFSAFVGHELI